MLEAIAEAFGVGSTEILVGAATVVGAIIGWFGKKGKDAAKQKRDSRPPTL